jgi:hypothetical protein
MSILIPIFSIIFFGTIAYVAYKYGGMAGGDV